MSTQPACTIRLPAKYIEDASDFIPSLTQTVPPSSAAVQGSSMPTLTLMPTNSDVGLSPLPDHPVATTKRPHAWPITINGDTNMDSQDLAPKLKKLKPTLAQAAVPVSQNKLSIIEIGDNDDLKSEWLNKCSPTADIKEFFIPLPCEPGQEKGRMRCKPCEYVVLSLSFIYLFLTILFCRQGQGCTKQDIMFLVVPDFLIHADTLDCLVLFLLLPSSH